MSKKLIEIYTSILSYSGLAADSQGCVNIVNGDKREPLFINGQRVVLPTDEQLRNFDNKERIVFHPLTENILRGESEVLTKLRQVINVRLNCTITAIATQLLSLVASSSQHKLLNPEQQELLISVQEVDSKTIDNFISYALGATKVNAERVFVNIFLKRGPNIRGKRHSRGGIVSFPMYEQLLEDKIEKIRVKDKQTFREIMKFILPEIEVEETYNFGSDSNVAPFLEALLRTSANIASRLNDILILYKDFIDDADKLMFDAEWMEYFQDMDALLPEIRKVPVQIGNDGSLIVKEGVQAQPTAPVQAPQPVYAQLGYPVPVAQAPMRPAAPELRKVGNRLDFNSLLAREQANGMMPSNNFPEVAAREYMLSNQAAYQNRPGMYQPPPAQMPMYQPGTILKDPHTGMTMVVDNTGNLQPYGQQQWAPAPGMY